MPVFTITRVSIAPGGIQPTASSFLGGFSPDGLRYAFSAFPDNLVAGDTNGQQDIFLKTLATGALERVSLDSNGNQLNGASSLPSFIDANRFVFQSNATNAVAGDGNGGSDVFIKNLQTNAVTLVSASAGGVIGNALSNLADNLNGAAGISLGDLVVFQSFANNLVAGDVNANTDVFVKNIANGAITLASTSSGGVQGNGASSQGRIASDGNRVVFVSAATNLVAGDTNAVSDIFVKNLTSGVLTRVSTDAADAQANAGASQPSFSPDGTKVVFVSAATNLVPGDTNGAADVFIKTLNSGAIERVSTDASGNQLAGVSNNPSFSPDGTKVIFGSIAANAVPGDTNARVDVFIKTLATGAIERVSISPAGVQGDRDSFSGVFSPDGNSVALLTDAQSLAAGDDNESQDVYVLGLVRPAAGAGAGAGGASSGENEGLAPRGPTFDAIGAAILRYLPSSLQPNPATVTTPTGQVLPNPLLAQRDAVLAMAPYDSGIANTQAATDAIVDMADGTTAVAAMNYQFFTGFLPSQAGFDFLINSTVNGADLNDGYYAAMTPENRSINFAVNLGKLGAGAAAFNAGYGALDLTAATTKAYAEIFGVTPTAAKVAAILTPARQAYLTALGGDAIGTKAAMVGYLLAEAAKADAGVYSVMIENFLYDLSDGVAAFGADAHIYLGAGPRSVSLIGLG